MKGDIVIASDEYGTVRIPRYITLALARWSKSADYPKGAPMWIDESGELVLDLRPPGKQFRSYYTDPNRFKRKSTGRAKPQ